MRYIDFDGVILETDIELFVECKISDFLNMPESEKVKYIQSRNWKKILDNSPIINDSIQRLKNINAQKSAILTKIHSLNEGTEKVYYLRKHGVTQNVILVPYPLKKVEVVNARNNILVDDSLFNLVEWKQNGGYPMFFDCYETNIDSWNIENTFGFQNVQYIDEFKNTKVRKRTNI